MSSDRYTYHPHEGDLSMETVRRVKRGETWEPSKRHLEAFLAQRRSPDHIWMRASVVECGRFLTCSWHCATEGEAVKWFNAYVELYGPPWRGEFLGFKYGNAKVSETGNVPPMSCGS